MLFLENRFVQTFPKSLKGRNQMEIIDKSELFIYLQGNNECCYSEKFKLFSVYTCVVS